MTIIFIPVSISSIIPGYEFDVFISYRQKDNKYDGWVIEFVDNLKRELEGTFKEDISVYFNINPHDGLLETHDVDASLKDKLKCLVFIPILSRTYCDPNSFAWVHEFKEFVATSSQDQFGLRVKLPNGNVANRVLPVRIHDLDADDIKECESVLGGVLRGVEFIYKEPGVNRSLTPVDDERINLNKTRYRNQINKVALAIKDLIIGMKAASGEPAAEKVAQKKAAGEAEQVWEKEVKPGTSKLNRTKILSGIIIAAVLIGAAILFYPKIFKRNTLERLRSSSERIAVAVMPFQNMTGDSSLNYWELGIQNDLISYLSNNPEELAVRQQESITTLIQSKGVTDYASITPLLAGSISKKLETDVFIFGTIKKAGPKIRINAQLSNSKTKEVFKSFEIEEPYKEEILFDVTDSLRKKIIDFLIITKLKKEELPFNRKIRLTDSIEAYRSYITGNKATDIPTKIKMYSRALEIDSNFYSAALNLINWYINAGLYSEAKNLCLRLYGKRDQMNEIEQNTVNHYYAVLNETPYEVIKYLRRSILIDDKMPYLYTLLAESYWWGLHDYKNAISEYNKALKMFKKWDIDPGVVFFSNLGMCYHRTGQYKKEKKIYRKIARDLPNSRRLFFRQAVLALTKKDTVEANQYIEKYKFLCKKESLSDAYILQNIGEIYRQADLFDKAEGYYRKALTSDPENPELINILAYFLINNNRNVLEGLELAEKTLRLRPDFYVYLDTKGWGLYKQGKYREALDTLQKSWDLRRQNAEYFHEAFLHLEAAKKAVEGLNKN